MNNPATHHDALEFPDGQVVLVTRLCRVIGYFWLLLFNGRCFVYEISLSGMAKVAITCRAIARIELKDDRETYLVIPDIARDIPGEYVMSTMHTCINRAGVVFLWPVRLPSPDGRQLAWHHSAQVAAEMAMKRWIRVKANMSLGAYDIFEASCTIPEPEWPSDISFPKLLEIAFKGRLVDSLDHPVLKRLRGET